MYEKIYELLTPSTGLLTEASLQIMRGRTCELVGDYEDDDGDPILFRLIFQGVEAFKCTYFRSVPTELIRVTYNKVVDLGQTPWLLELTERLHGKEDGIILKNISDLRHLAIYFYDGPCYEFICSGFRVEPEEKPHNLNWCDIN